MPEVLPYFSYINKYFVSYFQFGSSVDRKNKTILWYNGEK
jgi:hypothetical protein